MNELPDRVAPRLPHSWRWSAQAWRASRSLTRRRLDLLLRARSAAGLPVDRARFRAMGLPEEAIGDALRQVRSLAGWDVAWTWTAQRFLGEARRLDGEGRISDAALARRRAALSYHAALLLAFDDPKKVRALRASATALFAQALTTVMPTATRVEPVWRASSLPGYLVRPERGPGPAPLAVLLNGSTTAKEETVLWSRPFLQQGVAVLALDWPGTGEAAQSMPITADCDDLTDGILALAKGDPGIDERRVGLVGLSLGGALAVRAAAFDRRIAAVVAVTPPYDPPRWLPAANPVLIEQLTAAAGGPTAIADLAHGFSLPAVMPRLRCPLLVFGAGRDLVVPPLEAQRLCAAAGDRGTLLWFPHGSHGLYEVAARWAQDAARWLVAVTANDHASMQSTEVDLAASLCETNEAPTVAAAQS